MIACHIAIDISGRVTMRGPNGELLTTCGQLTKDNYGETKGKWRFTPNGLKDANITYDSFSLASELTTHRLEKMMNLLGIGVEG
jgi:hypothetical protein